MNTQLIQTTLNGYICWTLVDRANGNLFSFLPELGCCLNELKLLEKKVLRDIDSYKFDELIHKSFNGAQLFPFPNRLADGTYKWKGRNYTFEQNDPGRSNALHGILSNKRFLVEDDQSENTVSAKYEYRKDHSGYPFEFDIINDFHLGDCSLEITTRIENVGKEEAPIAHGWHPYFNGSGRVDACRITIPKTNQLLVNKDFIPTNETIKFESFNESKEIGQANFDTCYFGIDMGKGITFENPLESFKIHISTNGYEYMQIFIPAMRDTIAIEPQSCAPNAFNNQKGLIILDSGEAKEFSFKIELMN